MVGPLVLVDLLVETGNWVSTSGLRESSSSCSCSRGSRVCVMSFSSEFLCDCCLFDWLPLWRWLSGVNAYCAQSRRVNNAGIKMISNLSFHDEEFKFCRACVCDDL